MTAESTGDQPAQRNHYKGWKYPGHAINRTIGLSEASGGTAHAATLRAAVALFNPATKHHRGAHGIIDCGLHYVAYEVTWSGPIPLPFRITNQFTGPGGASWELDPALPPWLLVPAAKEHAEKSISPPKGDHLLCHAAKPMTYDAPIRIDDQFTPRSDYDIRPLHLARVCVPVTKQVLQDGPTEGVTYWESFLAIYQYQSPEKQPASVWTTDQFVANQLFQDGAATYLAVPSWKTNG